MDQFEVTISTEKDIKSYILLHRWPYWISALIVGLVAVGYSKIVSFSEGFSLSIYKNNPEYLFFLSPLFFLLSWALVYFLAPEAKGSGIPQVMAAVEIVEKGQHHDKLQRLLGLKVSVIKIISSALILLGGGAIGREGPTLQISASIFYFASKKFDVLKKYLTLDIWIITGAAAGLAAAFNTPLGGLVYAIEELATQHLNKFKSSLIAAVIIAGFSSQAILGPYLYLGYPKIMAFNMKLIPTIILISVLGGICGAFFGKTILYFTEMKSIYFRRTKYLFFIPVFCGLLTAVITYFVDHRFMGGGKELLVKLLFSGEISDFKVVFLRFIAPIITYLGGGAGGIFAPSLAAGGSLGSFIASNTTLVENNPLCTMLGMIAFLTGITRAPFTAFILVLEMTDRHSSLLPMMLAGLLANSAGMFVSKKSFYEMLKDNYTH